jgi:hypothetical protein
MKAQAYRINDQSICDALRISWLMAQSGESKWSRVLDEIDAMQKLLLYATDGQSTEEIDALKFLWSHALQRI